MSIRIKAFILLTLIFVLLVAVLYFFFSASLLHNLSQLERQEVEEEIHQIKSIIQERLNELDRVGGDWAPWDETYQFVEDGNEEYIRRNLTDEVFENLRLNVMLFVHRSGRVVYGKAYDLENHQEVPLPAAIETLTTDPAITRHTDPRISHTGIILLPDGPLFFSAWPISDSLYQGPIRGTLIVGRYLAPAEVERLSDLFGYPIAVYRIDHPEQMPSDIQMARTILSSGPSVLTRPLDEASIAGYTLLRDIHGNPALILRIRFPRTIYQQGKVANRFHFFSLVGIGLAFLGLSSFFMERMGISRVTALHAEVDAIGTTGDLSRRVRVKGKDELADLAAAINHMLDALQHAQQDLKESEERYRTVVAQASEGIALVDPETWAFLETNTAFQNLLGYTEEELRQRTLYDITDAPREPMENEAVLTIREEGAFSGERTYRRKDGARVDVEVSANRISHRGQNVLCLMVRDITERKRMERYLIQTERITAMGQLAATLTHEINNPLHSVWTALELVMDFPISESEKQEYLQAIRQEIQRLMNVSRRVLDFARPSRMEYAPVAIADVIRYALDLTKAQLRERRIQVHLDVPDDLPLVAGFQDQLAQVFLNLTLNAIDAMPEGGRLDIAARAEEGRLVVTVADTGPGIPPEVMPRIFEPFVTTKKSGTGLGLAISQSIIHQHGGTITAGNGPRGGAVFTITLPVS